MTVPQGYLRTIKAMAVGAIEAVYQTSYPETDSAGGQKTPFVSIEWPNNPQQVPGIWVDYEPAYLKIAGIAYTETDLAGDILTRWRFQGYVTLTAMALSSNECDLIYDDLVAMTAFAAQSQVLSPFRQAIDDNTLVACTWSFDSIEARGSGAMIGTPWGTDDPFWERGIALQLIGEFTTSPAAQMLVNLSQIKVTATIDGFPDGSSMIAVPPS